MNRISEKHLEAWSCRPNRKPLVLRGARQVGKTFLAEAWGGRRFTHVLKVDLERERTLHDLFDQPDPHALFKELCLIKGVNGTADNTLLFIDEIQAQPKALAGLRYFYELFPELHVIAAGSLLDLAMRSTPHPMPVGRVEFLHMQPLTFVEFTRAVAGGELASYLENWNPPAPISAALGDRFNKLLREYFFIGGMPEAVRAHAEGGSFLDVQRIQASILITMQEDFSKYGAKAPIDLLRQTFRHCALSVGRKFKYSNVSRESRASEVRKALEMLQLARIVSLVEHTAANGVPLAAEADRTRFKPLFLDTGLVCHMAGLGLSESPEALAAAMEGSLAEQFVGQELQASLPEFVDPSLNYWHREARNANAEVDFVVAARDLIAPIEVKAGGIGSLRSLHLFLAEKKRTVGIRLHGGGFSRQQLPSGSEIISLPLFMAGQTRRLLAGMAETISKEAENHPD